MRFKIILIFVIALTVVLAVFFTRPTSDQAQQGVVELIGLPDQYCPNQAAIVITDLKAKDLKIILDSTVAVDECRLINLKQFAVSKEAPHLLFIKLSNALAFRLQIDSISGRYQYAPSVGDVNDDNIIDSVDERLVTNALLSNDSELISKYDLDQDQKVSVLDLSYTRINSRSGVNRPDDQSWSQQ